MKNRQSHREAAEHEEESPTDQRGQGVAEAAEVAEDTEQKAQRRIRLERLGRLLGGGRDRDEPS